MNNKGLFIAVIAAVLIISINTYTLRDIENNLDVVNNNLRSIETGISLIHSISSKANVVQNTVNSEKLKDVFTPTELADYLNIHIDIVYDMIENPEAKLPFVCIDGEYRFSRSAIDEWLKSNIDISIVD